MNVNESQAEATVRGVSTVNIALGVWLIISPYLLGYASSQSRWNQTIAGIVVVLLALWRLVDASARWVSWANVVVAAWLVIAPFALGYASRVAYWNEVVVAVVLAFFAIGNANTHITHHHHQAT